MPDTQTQPDDPQLPPDFLQQRKPVTQVPAGVPGSAQPMSPSPDGGTAAPQKPAQEAFPSQAQIDKMMERTRANTQPAIENIERLGNERERILAQPLPHPAMPRYSNVPQAPKLEPRAFKDAMPGLIFTTVMGSLISRRHGIDAMNAASGYMEGWQKGDKDRMDLQRQNWQDAVDATIKQNNVEHERYQAVWNDTQLTVQDRQAKLAAIAASIGDQNTLAMLKNGMDDKAYKLNQDRQTAILKLEENRFKYGDAAVGVINEQGIKGMVAQYLAGDRMAISNIGRGAQSSRNLANFRNELAAEMERRGMSGAEVAIKMAEFEGLKAGMRLLSNREVNLGMGAQELINFAGPALHASEAIPRGKFVPINRLNQNIRLLESDPAMREFSNRNQGLISAYAQIISRTGVTTVHAQSRAEQLLNTAESQEAYQRAVDTLINEADLALKAPDLIRERMRGDFTARQGGGARPAAAPATPPAPTEPAGKVIKYDAEGNRVQ